MEIKTVSVYIVICVLIAIIVVLETVCVACSFLSITSHKSL